MKNFAGKICFVTGGASGAGLGQAKLFAKNGMKVAIADVREDALAAAAKEIIANYKPLYNSITEYLKAIDEISLDKDAVVYDENGNATVDFQNI